MKIILALAILLSPVALFEQTKTFRWNTMLCEYSGTYNSRKYSANQLKNTAALIMSDGLPLEASATVWNYDEIAKLDVAALDREYKNAKNKLVQMEIARSPFWESIRQKRLKELEEFYALSRTTMKAYTTPSVLRKYPQAASCKTKYADAIISGGDRLLAVWLVVNKDSRLKNSDPERLKRRFDEQMGSPDRLKFALVETMSFGWWNCANQFIEYDNGNASDAREREFKKLFIRIRKISFDEP
ncbi:MAG: hypothetical protein ACRD6X_06460 [Pyrinomonadaceae bacterium]